MPLQKATGQRSSRKPCAATAASKPSLLLMGETPSLMDEWQDTPVLWDAVRTMVDEHQILGQFILTGSAVVNGSKIHHSGTNVEDLHSGT